MSEVINKYIADPFRIIWYIQKILIYKSKIVIMMWVQREDQELFHYNIRVISMILVIDELESRNTQILKMFQMSVIYLVRYLFLHLAHQNFITLGDFRAIWRKIKLPELLDQGKQTDMYDVCVKFALLVKKEAIAALCVLNA